MTNPARQIHGQVCARASELARTERIPTTSHAVSGALLEAKIEVDHLTLDEWKAILFGAFQAASNASSPRMASARALAEQDQAHNWRRDWNLSVNQ